MRSGAGQGTRVCALQLQLTPPADGESRGCVVSADVPPTKGPHRSCSACRPPSGPSLPARLPPGHPPSSPSPKIPGHGTLGRDRDPWPPAPRPVRGPRPKVHPRRRSESRAPIVFLGPRPSRAASKGPPAMPLLVAASIVIPRPSRPGLGRDPKSTSCAAPDVQIGAAPPSPNRVPLLGPRSEVHPLRRSRCPDRSLKLC